jgi:hypothetical protein
MRDDSVDDPVFARLFGCHEVVALHVFRDPVERLAGEVHRGYRRAMMTSLFGECRLLWRGY